MKTPPLSSFDPDVITKSFAQLREDEKRVTALPPDEETG